jgi:hypothetical protein
MTEVTRRGVLKLVAGLGVVGVLGLLLGRWRFETETDSLVTYLRASARSESERTDASEDLTGLPDPVADYLETVVESGRPYTSTVRLQQRGEFRMGDRASSWKPFTATQHVTTDPPGFVWDASIEMAPLVPVRVVDSYANGTGALRAKVLSALTVANAEQGPELDAGELMRYLAESPWYPTALLPGRGVEWEPIDEQSARATLTHRETSVSLVFHFDDENLVSRVSSDGRYRTVGDDLERTPWTGYWCDYELRNGVRVPTSGEVEWNLPDGDLPYWRGTLTEIVHEPPGTIE